MLFFMYLVGWKNIQRTITKSTISIYLHIELVYLNSYEGVLILKTVNLHCRKTYVLCTCNKCKFSTYRHMYINYSALDFLHLHNGKTFNFIWKVFLYSNWYLKWVEYIIKYIKYNVFLMYVNIYRVVIIAKHRYGMF